MNLAIAEQYAKEKMQEHNLSDWQFEFTRAVRRFGSCNYTNKKIKLSRPLTELNNEWHVFDTILHEIAHALAGNEAGHGHQWKQKCIEIGCNPSRTYSSADVVTPPKNWRGKCPSCDRAIFRYDRSKIACGFCCKIRNGNKYSSDYLFVWERI